MEGIPERKHIFVPVVFRKQVKSTFGSLGSTSRFNPPSRSARLEYQYEKVAPPCILAIRPGARNSTVHKQLTEIAEVLVQGLAERSFEVVTNVDIYTRESGTELPADEEDFEITEQLGVTFLDTDTAYQIQMALPGVKNTKVEAPNKVTVRACMQEHFHREQLSDMNSVYCSKCKKHQRKWQSMSLWTVPSVLIVHLKRFGADNGLNGRLEKIRCEVELSLKMNLDEFLQGPASVSPTFELYGVVNHTGSLSRGHYTANALVTSIRDTSGTETGKWYNFNDPSVRACGTDDLDGKAGYILFYRRTDGCKEERSAS